MKILVTGGAGFIGSHLVDEAIKRGNQVIVYDNFSTGLRLFNLHHNQNPNFKVIKGDVLDFKKLKSALSGADFIFHLAGHADVGSGYFDHFFDHQHNLEGTHSVLEAMYQTGVKKILFASTSSVYGDATVHPTPESQPFAPTSIYGASKAAAETYIQAYSSYYNFQSYIFRFSSFVGERYTHGVIFQIVKKDLFNPGKIINPYNGRAQKSSLYIKDATAAMFTAISKSKQPINIFNVGNDRVLSIRRIIAVVLDHLGHRGGIIYQNHQSGWKGDNEYVLLDISALKSLGWEPQVSFEDGIRLTVDYLLANKKLLKRA